MYNFSKELESDERIIWQGKPVPGLGGKNTAGIIILIIFGLIFTGIPLAAIIIDNLNFSPIIVMLVGLFLLFLGIKELIYQIFLKKGAISDDYYCITNKRVFKYETKKDKLVYGYIINYEDIEVNNVENNYGDLIVSIKVEKTDYSKNIKNIFKYPSPTNMPLIMMESIQDPNILAKTIKDAREQLLKEMENNNKF